MADSPMVTMTLAQLDALRQQGTDAQAEIMNLRAEVERLKTRGPDGQAQKRFCQEALEIVCYTVANIPADTRGWPRAALRTLAVIMRAGDLPCLTSDDEALVGVFLDFLNEEGDVVS